MFLSREGDRLKFDLQFASHEAKLDYVVLFLIFFFVESEYLSLMPCLHCLCNLVPSPLKIYYYY